MTDRRALGKWGEDFACAALENDGFTVVGRNVRHGHFETDIIAADAQTLIFVEVKTRTPSNENFGTPAAAVNFKKRENLRAAARAYLAEHPEFDEHFIRFDVFEIIARPLAGTFRVISTERIEGAFTASER